MIPTSLEIFNVSPITYCWLKNYQPRSKPAVNSAHTRKVLHIVENAYGIPFELLASRYRRAENVRARHIAMYLLRHNTELSLNNIGDIFGGRDHTTVIHGIQRVEDQMKVYPEFKEEIMQLQSLL